MSLASNTRNGPESSEYRSCVEALLGVLSESETQQYYEKVHNVLTCDVCDMTPLMYMAICKSSNIQQLNLVVL